MSQANGCTGISRHYARADLAASIFRGLRRAGKDPDHFVYDDLSPVDQFHTMGKQASAELVQLLRTAPGTRVLDVGGGIGGSARMLAAEHGCRVTVLDLTREYCHIGRSLTERAGLSERVRFRHGDALDMPFADGSFDLVWTQHCTMNIDDKERLWAEVARVLRPQGHLALHEIMAGPLQPIHFPVPWASRPALSFLRPPAEVRALIERAGFSVLELCDRTAAACDWYRRRLGGPVAPPPPLGLHLLVGEDFRRIFDNVLRNYEEGRTVVVQAVCVKH